MTNLTKFFPTTEEVQDIVLWVDDVEASIKSFGIEETMGTIMDRVFVGDLKCSGYVHVIDDDKELAKNIAYLLDAKYQEEMVLMKGANKLEEAVKVLKKDEVSVNEDKNAAARAFLDDNGADIQGAKKAPVKEETTKGETKVKTQPKRRMGSMKQETTKEEEVSTVNKTNRQSTGNTAATVQTTEKGSKTRKGGRKQLGRQGSATQEFVKFEGPWYLNASLYPVLNRFESIIETMSDEELSITDIRLVRPEEIREYAKNAKVLVVVQILSNGAILNFPITDNAYENSSSDLGCLSIGWVPTKNGRRPAFGHKRPNEMAIEATCSCGSKLETNTGYIYCYSCRTRHAEGIVSVKHETLDFNIKEGWVFEKNPHMTVPQDILALAMAVAQYDDERGLDMWGVVEE